MREWEARGRHVRLPLEIRAEGDALTVAGYAAVFDQETDIGGFFRETIAPGAFAEAVGRDDVVLLVDHAGLPLARTRSGTLELSEDGHGLAIRAALDASDPDVQRVVPKLRRGDLDKMSFAFFPEREEWDETGPVPVRTIRQAALHDVSIVTFPAYDGTEVGLRSLEAHRLARRRENFSAARLRLRMKRDLELKVRENG